MAATATIGYARQRNWWSKHPLLGSKPTKPAVIRGIPHLGETPCRTVGVSMITGIVFIGLISSTTAALAAYPYVFTAWKRITISQDECVRRATNVLRNNNYTGMTAGIKGNDTMLGGLGDYVGLVRCAASVGIVFFVVTGPEQNPALNYTTALSNGF